MTVIYQKTKGLQDTPLHYCPGCGHGIVHKLIGESLEELGLLDTAVGICPVGCAVFAGNYFSCDIFINNAIYGMTGGQMAPTTLVGQRATTAPLGRDPSQAGWPIRMAEMLSTLEGLVYAERVCVVDIPHLNKAKQAIQRALQLQMAGKGFTFVEVLSACPTNWGMEPLEANHWLMEHMAAYYPLGVVKDTGGEAK